jgi:hypothetical protein
VTQVRGAFLKLRRAKEHLDLINREAVEFIEDHLQYEATLIDDELGHQWDELIWANITLPHERFGIWLGDFVHNVRAALDYCVYAAVEEANGKPGKHTQFPIYWSPDKWDEDVVHRVKPGLSPLHGLPQTSHQFALIDRIQPYHVPQQDRPRHLLLKLQRMSNIDKHRKLHAANGVTGPPEISYSPPGYVEVGKIEMVPGFERLDPGAKIGRVERIIVSRPPPGTEVKVRLRGTATLEFGAADQGTVAFLFDLPPILDAVYALVSGFAVAPHVLIPTKPPRAS